MKNTILYVFPKPTTKSKIFCFVGVEINGMLYLHGVGINSKDSEFKDDYFMVKASDTTEPYEVNGFYERILRVNSQNSVYSDYRIMPFISSQLYKDMVKKSMTEFEEQFRIYGNDSKKKESSTR